jgi:bacterioferritin
MKGNQTVIETLNDLLADELTAINQYMVHSEVCKDWGYEHLHEVIEKRAITEMRHAEKLIGRILFLEGTPIVSNLKPMHIGADVPKQLENDRLAEATAVASYNKAAQQAADHLDNGTRDMLQDILTDEEAHLDELESQLDQVAQMGLQNFLQAQLV